jgi:tetratricopeptide (TPR) repeat protein
MSSAVARPDVEAAPGGRRWGVARLLRAPVAVLAAFRRRPGRCLAVAALVALIFAGAAVGGAYLWAAHHLRAARSCLERYRNAEARDHLDAVRKVWPRDPETLLLAARTARRLRAAEDAALFLEECQKVRGKDDTDLFLEQVLLRVEQGEMDRLGEFCQTLVVQEHPSAPLVLEALTRAALRQLRYGDAEMAIGKWLARRPDDVGALYYHAFLLDQKMMQRDAAEAYRRVLDRDPEFDEARGRLVEVLLQTHAAAEAQEHLVYLRRHRPDDPSLAVALARCREQQGQREEAERLLEDVLARYPDHGQALFERGHLALREGQPEAAESWLRRAVAREQGDFKIRYAFFLCLGRNGKAAEAAEEQRLLDKLRADMDRIQEITARDMQADPHNPALHCEVGLIALRAGALEEGKRWLHSALKEDPHYLPAHRALAVVYDRTGEPSLAAHHRAAARAPQTPGPSAP